MAAELLVACLWGGLLVYWLWRRRPSFSDSIGSFRHELSVLGQAAPTRVPPAHRLDTPSKGRSGPGHLALQAASASSPPPPMMAALRAYHRLEVRRRRRDVLLVLCGAVFLSLLFALVTGSDAFLYLQFSTDVLLAAYLYMLVRANNSLPARSTSHVLPTAHAHQQRWPASYGDFRSYAELSAARAS